MKLETALSETNAENGEYTTAWKFENKAIKLRKAIDSIDNKQEAEKMKASYRYELEVAKRRGGRREQEQVQVCNVTRHHLYPRTYYALHLGT